jgi:hypothetical protein
MATASVVRTLIGAEDGSAIMFTWTLTTGNPDGEPVSIPEWFDRTWHAYGTLGAATMQVEGSGDKTNWAPCNNAAGGAVISITSLPKIISNIENSRWIRPNLSTPGAGASWTVILTARRQNPMRQ